MKNYLLTIKNNSNKFTALDDLYSVKSYVSHLGSNEIFFTPIEAVELDSLNRLHMHCIVYSMKSLYYTKYKVRGYSVHFKPFPDKDTGNVVGYLQKTGDKYPRITEFISKSNFQNCFIPKLTSSISAL